MKKLLIVTDVWTETVNGVVTAIKHTKEELEKQGIEVVMVHPKMFRTIPLPFYSEIKLAMPWTKTLIEIFKREKSDAIHISTGGPLGFKAALACKKAGFHFTTMYHTRLPEYIRLRLPIPINLSYKYFRWFHNMGDKTLVSVPSLKEELESHGFKNIVISPLGVDVEVFKKNPSAVIPAGLMKPIFAYLGRIAVEKSVEDFLKCNLPGSKLVIGDGPDLAMLKQKYRDNVLFTGYKRGQEIVDLLSVADVFVFPSRTDTFGLTIIEALACEVPAAAYNVQGPKDIITNGVDGYLGDNLEQNALACLKLDRTKLRATALRYSWAEAGRRFIENQVPLRHA